MQPLNVRYSCGSVMTVLPNDLAHFTYQQMFFKNATVWIVCLNYECYSFSFTLFTLYTAITAK